MRTVLVIFGIAWTFLATAALALAAQYVDLCRERWKR